MDSFTHDWPVILSVILNIAGSIVYLSAVIRRKTIPKTATWGLLSIIGVMVLIIEIMIGAKGVLYFVAAQTIGVAAIFAVSLRYGTREIGHHEWLIVVGSIIALGCWYLSNDPFIALVALISSRALAVLLTVIKAYQKPSSEAALPWFLYGLSAVVTLIISHDEGIKVIAYPLYVVAADTVVIAAKYHARLRV